MFNKFLTATLVAASFSVSAMAQSITESDATNIMDNYRSGFNALSINLCLDRNKQSLTGRDLQQAFTLKQNEVVQLLNRGDRTMAAAKASTMLNGFGHCYGKATRQTDREIYAGFMGGFIATQALAYGDDGKMQQAITLLDYANSHGQTNKQFLNLVEEHRAVKLDVNSDERVQLSALESELQENSLRFENNYKGKAVAFEAVVTSVGYDNLIRKMRLGFKQGEYIGSCSFPKGAIDDKLMTLNKGDKVLIAATPYVYSGILGDSLHVKNCQF